MPPYYHEEPEGYCPAACVHKECAAVRAAIKRKNRLQEIDLDKLLPCPFCGEEEDVEVMGVPYDTYVKWDVTCDGCGTYGPSNITSAAEAKRAWNERKEKP